MPLGVEDRNGLRRVAHPEAWPNEIAHVGAITSLLLLLSALLYHYKDWVPRLDSHCGIFSHPILRAHSQQLDHSPILISDSTRIMQAEIPKENLSPFSSHCFAYLLYSV